MNNVVGKEASQKTGSEIYFQTYQKLLRQRQGIDRELLKMQGRFFKAVSSRKNLGNGEHIQYVPRLKNTTTLVLAIRACMVPNTKMSMAEILTALRKKKLYQTSSKYFYTMVNNKLNRDEKIEKTSRGIFVYKPRRKKSAVA